jgi:hypothetical protein
MTRWLSPDQETTFSTPRQLPQASAYGFWTSEWHFCIFDLAIALLKSINTYYLRSNAMCIYVLGEKENPEPNRLRWVAKNKLYLDLNKCCRKIKGDEKVWGVVDLIETPSPIIDAIS